MPAPPPQPLSSSFISPFDIVRNNNATTITTANTTPSASNITTGSSRPLIRPILNEGHRLVDSADFGSEAYEDEKNDVRLSTSVIPRRDGRRSLHNSPNSDNNINNNPRGNSNGKGNSHNSRVTRRASDNTTLRGAGGSPSESSANSTISPDSTLGPPIDINQPRPRLEQVGPHIATATMQAYNILTVVRSVADPTWMVLKTSRDKTGGKDDDDHMGRIGKFEIIFLGLTVACALLSCIGFSLRIMDRMTWIRRAPVVTSYLQTLFSIAAIAHYLATQKLPPGAQYSHGFLTCVLTIILSSLVATLLTIDWIRGFPSPGLSVVLKQLIISSFVMTIVIIIGAATYTWLEGWSFDSAVNFCIVSFSTIGYGNVSPQTIPGRIIFFFYAVIGISAVGYFIVALRNAVLEQFQWRLLERFSKPAHITRVQTRMSTKDMSFPLARFEEEQRVKKVVKRKMIVRMSTLWIVLWFGGAGVFCGFETWSYLDSLYFCFVTLTTVGFGDMVPTEPGSIEFWNIYVFLGLTVFAYILSLFSDTMASQIHLVDDGEGEDEDEEMYGWEQCEDPNYQFSAWKGGAALGLDGVKWAQQQDAFKVNPGQGLGLGLQGQELTDTGSNLLLPGQQMQSDRPKGLQRMQFWNSGGGAAGGMGVGPLDGQPAPRHPLDGLDLSQQLPQQQQQQKQQQQQQQMSQQRPRYKAQRRNSVGRILMIPAKERKQMLEAEYYATHGGPPVEPSSGITNAGAVNTGTDGATTATATAGGGGMMAVTVPATIKFVDKYGIPHQRVVGRRMSYIPGGIQAHNQQFGDSGMESGAVAGTSTAHMSADTTAGGGGHPLGGVLTQQQQQQQQQGYTFSTTGYSDALAKRRGTMAIIHQQQQEQHGHPHHHNRVDSHAYGHDGGQGQGQSVGRPQTPMQDQLYHSHSDDSFQTGALEHQPTVRFESPRTRSRNRNGNGGSATLQRVSQQIPHQQQQLQQQQSRRWQPDQNQNQCQSQYRNQCQDPLSSSPLDSSSSYDASYGVRAGGGGLKMPWPTTGDNDYGNDYSGTTADLHTKTTSDAFARYLNLDHTRQSHSSDVTKVGSPPVDVHLGSSSPFFVGNDDKSKMTNAVGGQSRVAGEVGVGAGTGMQTPPSSQPATKAHPHGSGGGGISGGEGGRGGGGDRNNTIGPWDETRNSGDLPAFAMDFDLSRKGGVGSSTATATAAPTMSMVQPPSNPQSPSGARVTAQVQPPPPSSRQSLPPSSPSFPLSGNAMTNQEVGPFGETKDPNRLPEFNDHVDSNLVERGSRPNPSSPHINSSSSSSNNNNTSSSGDSGETTLQQHQHQPRATPEHIVQSSSSSPFPPSPLVRPPAGPITPSSYSSISSYSSPIKSSTNTKNNTKGGVNNSNNSINSINPRTTTTTSLSMVPPLDDSPVGPFGETRQHLPTNSTPSPPFSSPSSGAGGSSGLPLVPPLTKAKDVELIRTMSGQHHNQDQTNTINTTPDPFQSSNSSSLWSSHHPAYDFESVYRESGNPFLSFSRQTSTGKEKGGRRGPLSPPSPSPRGEKSASPSESSPPWLLQQHQTTSTNTNPFLPQWNMTSQQQQQQHQQQLAIPDSRAHPLSSSLAVHSPHSQLHSQSHSQSQLQSQPRTRDQEQGSGVQQDHRGPFDEPRPSRNNSIPSWFEQDVDLNKIGPDPSQVDEARKSVAEIERRTSAKKADQQRLASSLSPSVSTSASSGDQ